MMEDEKRQITFTFTETGLDIEVHPLVNSALMYGAAAQLNEFARMRFLEEIAPKPTQQQIAVARGIPGDHRKKGN